MRIETWESGTGKAGGYWPASSRFPDSQIPVFHSAQESA
jgi:hypothetical protein